MSMQANSSFFIMIYQPPVCTAGHLDAFGNLCLTADFIGCCHFVQRQSSACQNGLFLSIPRKEAERKEQKGIYLHFKAGKAVWGHNSNVGSRRVLTRQLFLKAFSTLAILHLLSRKSYTSYTEIIKSSKEIRGIEISDYI